MPLSMTSSSKEKKLRLDEIVVGRGFCETRSQARALIMAGKVRRGDEVLDKPGKTYPESIALTLIQPPRFVGRGGEKLEAFLAAHPLPVEGGVFLDVGASTGGFTDCLLQRGASAVTCVDVGRGQLHGKLRSDPRVTNIEKLNARHLTPDLLPRPAYDGVVMDLSFISLRLVLLPTWNCLKPGGWLAALVKPQFEADRREVDRGAGVIKDPAVQNRVLDEIRAFALETLPGATLIGTIDSPLRGADGNREFLLGLIRRES
jgi:23S rRNA (cytidine1920-2'-O)/16S rRNA (cytidine1409-2'-O)-methyltransferase